MTINSETIGVPQEFDETGSNLILKGFGLAEHDLFGREGDIRQ